MVSCARSRWTGHAMIGRLIVAITIAAALASSASAQRQAAKRIELGSERPSDARFRSAINKLPAPERSSLLTAAKKHSPVFVFVPGILGSKLTKKTASGDWKLIWGQISGASIDPDLAYSDTDEVRAEVL